MRSRREQSLARCNSAGELSLCIQTSDTPSFLGPLAEDHQLATASKDVGPCIASHTSRRRNNVFGGSPVMSIRFQDDQCMDLPILASTSAKRSAVDFSSFEHTWMLHAANCV